MVLILLLKNLKNKMVQALEMHIALSSAFNRYRMLTVVLEASENMGV